MDTNIDQALFQPLETQTHTDDEIVRPSITYWQDAWRRLKTNKPAMISLAVIIIIILSAIFVPLVWPYDYSTQIRGHENQGLPGNIPLGPTASEGIVYPCIYGARIP